MTLSEVPAFDEAEAEPSKRILILGAGYGGLRAAQMLGKELDSPNDPEVVLVDRYTYHQVITELPVAASGRIGTDEVALPLNDLLRRSRVRFLQADITEIDIEQRLVTTTRGNVRYGTLIVALGSTTAFYGVPGLADHALTLKSVEDADRIKQRVQAVVVQAAAEQNEATRFALLSILIGGAGLTGVELAGELAEYVPDLAREHGLPPDAPRILLVEAAPAVLPSMPRKLQTSGARVLTDLGVHLFLGSKVVIADAEGISLASGDRLVGRTLVWTGGIMAPPMLAQSGLPTARNGQVPVDEYLRLDDYPEVYVVGDSALVTDGLIERPLAPTAQVALQQAETAAYNIYATERGWANRPFSPHDKGQVISLGSARGVASVFDLPLTGRKVMALKSLIEEGYRFAVTGKLSRGRKPAHAEG